MLAGVGIDDRLGLSRPQQRELVQEAARLGYDSLWTPTGATARSAFVTCFDWWQASTSVVPAGLDVGVSVVPFPAWTVPSLAAQGASVGELTGGKFKLGIGLGGYPAPGFNKSLGLADYPPLTFTREYVRALTGMLRGDSVESSGKAVNLHGVKLAFKAPRVPVYLAALGPQMLRLSGELADGVTPNWSSAEEIAKLREIVAQATPQGEYRPFAQYIRMCIDEDEDAARRAFTENMLSYAMARPGQPKNRGYRAHFARMGFLDVLEDVETRRDAGTPMAELVDRVPAALALKVGYFGNAAGAAEALRRLSVGLDEAIVRLITTRGGSLDLALAAVRACAPSGWRGDR
jgi:5,10-methylenetetrahydromethanopterin reductase